MDENDVQECRRNSFLSLPLSIKTSMKNAWVLITEARAMREIFPMQVLKTFVEIIQLTNAAKFMDVSFHVTR